MSTINREVIEQYLQANGVSTEAAPEDIKQLLFSAKWHENDIKTALTILREDPESHETTVDSLHRVFHSDDRMRPETISALLGVDVAFVPEEQRAKRSRLTFRDIFFTVLIASSLAGLLVLAAMWYLEMGIFYST